MFVLALGERAWVATGVAVLTVAITSIVIAWRMRGSSSDSSGSSSSSSSPSSSSPKTPRTPSTPTSPTSEDAGGGIRRAGFSRLRVRSVEQLTATTYRLRIALTPPTARARIPAGQHLHLGLADEPGGKIVSHSYTPVACGDGYVDICFRVYPEGRLTPRLAALRTGAIINVRGPTGRFVYEDGAWPELCMIAGGTGLTPILAVAKAALGVTCGGSGNVEPHSSGDGAADDGTGNDRSRGHPIVRIVYCSSHADDVMARPELDALASQHRGVLTVTYVASRVPAGCEWDGTVGRISGELLSAAWGRKRKPGAHGFVCGPPGFVNAARLALETVGIKGKDDVTVF